MSSKPRKHRQSSKSRAREKYRADVRELKRLGLYHGDLRRPITDYAAKQARRYQDVLKGSAAVVRTPSRKHARTYKQQFKTKYRHVVIPRQAGERIFYDRKSGEIIGFRHQYGRDVKRIIPAHAVTPENVGRLPRGKNIWYTLPIGAPGHVERFQSFDDLAQFMQQYETPHIVADKYGVRHAQYKNWMKYVEIEEIMESDDVEE